MTHFTRSPLVLTINGVFYLISYFLMWSYFSWMDLARYSSPIRNLEIYPLAFSRVTSFLFWTYFWALAEFDFWSEIQWSVLRTSCQSQHHQVISEDAHLSYHLCKQLSVVLGWGTNTCWTSTRNRIFKGCSCKSQTHSKLACSDQAQSGQIDRDHHSHSYYRHCFLLKILAHSCMLRVHSRPLWYWSCVSET